MNDAIDTLALRTLAPLDAVRAWALRRCARAMGPLLVRPALRHAVFGGTGVERRRP